MDDQASINRIRVGGILVDVLDSRGWSRRIVAHSRQRSPEAPPMVSFYANGQVLVEYARSSEYRALVDKADAITADGQPIVWASRLTRHPLPERVAVTDFFDEAAEAAASAGLSFYLLGSTPENIETAVRRIRSRHPQLDIVGFRNGYFGIADEADVVQKIKDARPDVLWVGLGTPRQEQFVMRNREALRGVGWIKTCGGLFDYFTPHVKRAPKWMQNMSLEWLFRTVQEPRKYLRRYATTNTQAIWLLLTRTERR